MATSTTATTRGMDTVAQCRGAGNGRSTVFRATRHVTVAAEWATPDIVAEANTAAASQAAAMQAEVEVAAMQAAVVAMVVAAVTANSQFRPMRYSPETFSQEWLEQGRLCSNALHLLL